MKKTSIAILSFTLFATLAVMGCGHATTKETANKEEVVKMEKEDSNMSKKDEKGLNIQVGSKDGVNVNIGDNNKSLDIQVGAKEDGVAVKMGEDGLKVNIGDKEGGISINLGSFLK